MLLGSWINVVLGMIANGPVMPLTLAVTCGWRAEQRFQNAFPEF